MYKYFCRSTFYYIKNFLQTAPFPLGWSELKWSEVAQSCLTLCRACSPPGSSVHGIFQAWILEWVAISFSRGSSRPRDWTRVSRIVGRRFTIQATREALPLCNNMYLSLPCMCGKALSHVWLCNSMNCSPPGSSVHVILWAGCHAHL